MEVGISDIQSKDGKVEITFCTYPECEDFLVITIDEKTTWEIHDFCQSKLSYGAKLKKERNGKVKRIN